MRCWDAGLGLAIFDDLKLAVLRMYKWQVYNAWCSLCGDWKDQICQVMKKMCSDMFS